MDKTKELAKALILEKFNACVQGGATQSEIDANIDFLADLVVSDSKEELIKYAESKKEKLEAEKAALAKQKLDAEVAYDKAINVAVEAQAELEK